MCRTGFDTCRHHHPPGFHFSIEFNYLEYRSRATHLDLPLPIQLCGINSAMFKISIIEARGHRKLVLEGKLVSPWTAEVESTWRSAEQPHGRLIVDLTNVTLISPDGEETLLRMMKEGARFTCRNVLTKHVLRQLARRCRCQR